MTLHAEILARLTYNTTDITNQIVDVYDILSLHAGSTLAENDSEDWDRIAKVYVLYLLDRLRLERLSTKDPSVVVPPQMNEEIRMLINKLIMEPEERSTLLLTKINTPLENWYDPAVPRS